MCLVGALTGKGGGCGGASVVVESGMMVADGLWSGRRRVGVRDVGRHGEGGGVRVAKSRGHRVMDAKVRGWCR